MVQSVELLLDSVGDEEIRQDWQRLMVAGLPSQGRHTAPSNRPHVTVAVAEALDREAEEAVMAAARSVDPVELLPIPLVLDGLVVFPGRRSVLARSVAPSTALLRVQRTFAELIARSAPVPENLRPGGWTPHVTLARGLTGADLAAAVELVGHRRIATRVVAIRRWDGSRRLEWIIGGQWSAGSSTGPSAGSSTVPG